MGLGYWEIAHRLNISDSTAFNTFKLHRQCKSKECKKTAQALQVGPPSPALRGWISA